MFDNKLPEYLNEMEKSFDLYQNGLNLPAAAIVRSHQPMYGWLTLFYVSILKLILIETDHLASHENQQN